MATELAGKRVLVTGASSGIGAGLAVGFARAGATVGIAARREDRLAKVLETCRETSPGSRMWVADLAEPGTVDRLAADATEELGGVDILVNCAGIPKRRHVTRLDARTVTDVMNINYLSPVRLTLALLPQMLGRGDGLVVNVASVAATLSSPGEAAYDASKAALAVFSEAMFADLFGSGVRVLIVYPGVVDTELFHLPDNDAPIDAVTPITVEEAVDAVFKAIEDGVVEVYVPEWFRKIVVDKASDVEHFLSGAAEFVRSRST
jgi:short-subunit dehydrogenase